MFDLRISLGLASASAGGLDPRGVAERDVVRGGPDALLQWLEVQLAAQRPGLHRAARTVEYLQALEATELVACAASFARNPLATAEALLARRDELLEEGWTGEAHPALPPVAQDLARAEAELARRAAKRGAHVTDPVLPGRVDRIRSIHGALDAGQTLPDHRVTLAEPSKQWPRSWRPLLARLSVVEPSGDPEAGSFRGDWKPVRAASVHRAAQFIARQIAEIPATSPKPLLVCEDRTSVAVIDEALREAGLPAIGVDADVSGIPVTQILPLSLELCWEPVFPQRIVDFLSLPVSPIPGRAARKLAHALSEKPGLGSEMWEKAWAELTSPEADPEGQMAETLTAWLHPERHDRAAGLPARLVAERARQVAHWLARRAAAIARDVQTASQASGSADDSLAAWHVALGQATQLAELAEAWLGDDDAPRSSTLTEPRVRELITAVERQAAAFSTWLAGAGAVRWVRSWAEVVEPVGDVIWFGVGQHETHLCRWSRPELRALKKAGVAVDDGTRALAITHAAERRGLERVSGTLWSWELPSDCEKRAHPIRLELEVTHSDREPIALEPALASDRLQEIVAGAPATREIPRAAGRTGGHALQTVWKVDPAVLSDRDYSSASELESRLGCPLRWTFNYAAKLRARDGSQLKRGALLRGDFCHHVLERLFTRDGQPIPELPDVDAAAERVAALFDERLPLEAAELAQADQVRDKLKLRQQLVDSTRTLVSALTRGGYRVVGMELPLESTIAGRRLMGYIDCAVEDASGHRAVIDFKYGYAPRYRELLEEGRAVQLATYASGGEAAVAYLTLTNAQLHTPEGSALRGALPTEIAEGAPDIQQVWRRFESAVRTADGWLATGAIPVRPHQGRDEWPAGTDLVVKWQRLPDGGDEPGICRYCDYRLLCGREEPR